LALFGSLSKGSSSPVQNGTASASLTAGPLGP